MIESMTRAGLTLSVLILAGLACTIQVQTPEPARAPEPTITQAIPTRASTITPLPTQAGQTFTVTATTLYIRDRAGEVAGYLHHGDLVTCVPTDSGWCLIDRGLKVWAGCLEPNPRELKCEAK